MAPKLLLEANMGKKIYVGNLSYSTDDQSLAGIFSEFGNVDTAKVIMDRDSGRSKGFGFVEMTDANEADAAIEKLNGKEHGGRTLNVSEAKPMAPRDNNRGGGKSFGGGGGERRSRY